MSFGIRDVDWVEPDDEPMTSRCKECNDWAPCPCGRCGWGWCFFSNEFTYEDEHCDN